MPKPSVESAVVRVSYVREPSHALAIVNLNDEILMTKS